MDVDKELEKMEGRGRKRDAPSGNRFEARQQSKKRVQRDSKFGEWLGAVVAAAGRGGAVGGGLLFICKNPRRRPKGKEPAFSTLEQCP